MTAWRRPLPTPRRAAPPPGPSPRVTGGTGSPWVPDDPASGGREGPATSGPPQPSPQQAPPPGVMPVIVSEWELTEDAAGGLKSRPRLLSVPRAAVTVKEDDAPGRERVRRFVEAWRWLIAARTQIQSAGLSADESDRYLAGAGVLVRVVPPGSGRRSRRRT